MMTILWTIAVVMVAAWIAVGVIALHAWRRRP